MIWIYCIIIVSAIIGILGFINVEDGMMSFGILFAAIGLIIWGGVLLSGLEIEGNTKDITHVSTVEH